MYITYYTDISDNSSFETYENKQFHFNVNMQNICRDTDTNEFMILCRLMVRNTVPAC